VARFHELAVLCHEHAVSHKLPDLDLSSSIQVALEDRVDRTLLRLHGFRKKSDRPGRGGNGFWNQRKTSANPFFPGLWGDRLDSSERQLVQFITASSALQSGGGARPEDDAQDEVDENSVYAASASVAAVADPSDSLAMVLDGTLPFCLPLDIKSEVYSKPPAYTHIQSLKYSADKDHRPKRVKTAAKEDQERCKCTGPRCGDDCFNRAIMAECVGPANCHLGTKDCGNRGLGKRQYVKCQPQRERGRGWGLVTLEAVPKGGLVHEYVGEVIDEREKTERLQVWNMEHPNDPNFYVMALSGGYYVDAREYANQSRFINHSCAPNCKVVSVNVRGHIRNGIYSIRDIQAGEFLSYDYHFDTKQGDRFVCRCGAPNCRGTMKGGGKHDKDDPSLKRPSNWKEAKARYEADRIFLNELQGADVVSLVDFALPEAENPSEVVSAGPLAKHRELAMRNRIFLWRNVKLGSDFISRFSRLEATRRVGRPAIEKDEEIARLVS
jgi:SET domain